MDITSIEHYLTARIEQLQDDTWEADMHTIQFATGMCIEELQHVLDLIKEDSHV